MKTKADIRDLNFNDYAFFKGVSVAEAKWALSALIYDAEEVYEHLTKSGVPLVKIGDRIPVSEFDFTMRSNSGLDGDSQLEYLCDYYNKGVPLQKLREYSQNKAFISAIKFTGKHTIVNDILNPDQLLKLQKTWLLKSSLYAISDNAIKFQMKNEWAMEYMYENGVSPARYEKAKTRYLERTSKDKKSTV